MLYSIVALPWLKFIPVVVPVGIMLWDVRRDKRKKGWFHRYGLPIVSGISAVIACWIISHDSRESSNWQQEAKRWQAESAAQMNRIEGKLGDESATQRYLEAVRKLTRQLTNEKTGTIADRFFASEAERKKLREEVVQANQRLLRSHQVRMEPVVAFIVGKFDSWIDAIRKRGIVVQAETDDYPAITTDGNKFKPFVRKATFKSGDFVMLQLTPAIIEGGQMPQNLHFQMPFHGHNAQPYEIWGCDVYEQKYNVNNPRPSKFVFKSFEGDSPNPIEDQKLIDALNDSFDEVMGFVIDEASVQGARTDP